MSSSTFNPPSQLNPNDQEFEVVDLNDNDKAAALEQKYPQTTLQTAGNMVSTGMQSVGNGFNLLVETVTFNRITLINKKKAIEQQKRMIAELENDLKKRQFTPPIDTDSQDAIEVKENNGTPIPDNSPELEQLNQLKAMLQQAELEAKQLKENNKKLKFEMEQAVIEQQAKEEKAKVEYQKKCDDYNRKLELQKQLIMSQRVSDEKMAEHFRKQLLERTQKIEHLQLSVKTLHEVVQNKNAKAKETAEEIQRLKTAMELKQEDKIPAAVSPALNPIQEAKIRELELLILEKNKKITELNTSLEEENKNNDNVLDLQPVINNTKPPKRGIKLFVFGAAASLGSVAVSILIFTGIIALTGPVGLGVAGVLLGLGALGLLVTYIANRRNLVTHKINTHSPNMFIAVDSQQTIANNKKIANLKSSIKSLNQEVSNLQSEIEKQKTPSVVITNSTETERDKMAAKVQLLEKELKEQKEAHEAEEIKQKELLAQIEDLKNDKEKLEREKLQADTESKIDIRPPTPPTPIEQVPMAPPLTNSQGQTVQSSSLSITASLVNGTSNGKAAVLNSEEMVKVIAQARIHLKNINPKKDSILANVADTPLLNVLNRRDAISNEDDESPESDWSSDDEDSAANQAKKRSGFIGNININSINNPTNANGSNKFTAPHR